MREINWAGNYEYRARKLHRPTSVEQVQEIVAAAPSVHVLGSRHSFHGIADAAGLLRLDALPADVLVDPSRSTVTLSGGLTYAELAQALSGEGLALHNLASLPHISIAGAVMTATHGSGNRNGNLATAVARVEMVTSSGEVVSAARGDPEFEGMVVGLGALGAVTGLTLDVEPAYEVRQRTFEGLEWSALADHFDEITGLGHSVSVFTRWGPKVEQVWVKSRAGKEPEDVLPDLFGAVPATVDRHPVLGLDPVNSTPQLGRPGPWSDRLPHFRIGYRPGTGDELQSEYLVARRDGLTAIERVRAVANRIQPLLRVAEIRTWPPAASG
jgi:xylitol oxidase